MVIRDYHVTMKKPVIGVAEFKARLSEYLRSVRKGQELTIADRDHPIARVVPYRQQTHTGLVVREPARSYATLGTIPLPEPAALGIDIVDLLLDDRNSR